MEEVCNVLSNTLLMDKKFHRQNRTEIDVDYLTWKCEKHKPKQEKRRFYQRHQNYRKIKRIQSVPEKKSSVKKKAA